MVQVHGEDMLYGQKQILSHGESAVMDNPKTNRRRWDVNCMSMVSAECGYHESHEDTIEHSTI